MRQMPPDFVAAVSFRREPTIGNRIGARFAHHAGSAAPQVFFAVETQVHELRAGGRRSPPKIRRAQS